MSSRGDAGCMSALAGLVIWAMLCAGLYQLVGKGLFWTIMVLATVVVLGAIWRRAK